MKPIPLIRAAALRPFAGFLAGIGAPVESLWSRAHLPVSALGDSGDFVPLFFGVRFAEDAARSQGIDLLGSLVGGDGVAGLGWLGAQLRRSLTLVEAIRRFQAIQPVWNTGARTWLVKDGSSVRLAQRSRWREAPSRQVDIYLAGLMVEVVSAATGDTWRPAEIDLQSGGEPFSVDSGRLAGVRINVGRPTTSFSFPRSLLSRRLQWSSPQPASAAEPRSRAPSSVATDFLGSVREIVAALLKVGESDVVVAAEAAGTSVRSLQRGLQENGVSFSRLVDEVRFALSSRRLEDPDVKIVEIALELGYSDPAHFTRAFRRWSSVTPFEYRRLRLLESGDRRRSA